MANINTFMAYKSFKFLLKPTSEQKQSLSQMGGACRWLWNYMLAEQKKHYASGKKFLFRNAMNIKLPDLKKTYPWLKDVPSQALQQKCGDLDKALQRVFKSKFGFPKFKSKADNKDSFRIANSPKQFKVTHQAIKMPKLGWVSWIRHRPIEGRLVSVTFKQEGDRWYAVCLCEVPDAAPVADISSDEIIGIDLGLSSFAIRIANALKIPVYNLHDPQCIDLFKKLLNNQLLVDKLYKKQYSINEINGV